MSDRGARSGPPSGPVRIKLAFLTWVGAYAVITLILGVLGPTIASSPLALRTLLISVLMVIALNGFLIPTLTRIFAGWIRASAPRRPTSKPRASANPHAN